jgi:hypothetical protein
MANTNFVIQNGLTVGPLTIWAANGDVVTTGNISTSGTSENFNTINAVAIQAGTIGNTSATVQGGTILSLGGGQITGYHTGAIGANTANTGVFTTLTATSGYQGATSGPLNGTVGASTPNSGVFTTLTATSGYQGATSGPINGTVGASTPNSGAFTTLTATSGYQGATSGPLNGTVGASTPNSGAFTTLTATSFLTVSGTGSFAGTLNAATLQASTIGNSGATLYGTLNSASASQTNITSVGTLTGLTVNGTSTLGATTASTVSAGTIGNSGATLSGATLSLTSDATVGGNLTVNGNIIQNGSVTTLNANNLTINDTVIYMANNNPANSYDIGIVGHFTAGTYQHTGIIRDHNTNIWTFFSNVSTEPTGNILTFDGNTTYDTVKLGSLNATNNITAAGRIDGALYGPLNGTVGATTANTGAFTTLTATSGYQGAASGPFNGTVGATTANTGAFTTLTATSGYQGAASGPFNGTVGATTANTGAFTTLTASSTLGVSGTANFAGTLNAATVNATAIGNSATALTGISATVAGTITAATIYCTTLGNSATVFTASSSTVSNSLTVNSANNVTAIVNGGTTGTGNIGSSSSTFNTVFAKATTAQYADLAECYAADAEYAPGTVVDFGGDAEITLSPIDASPRVAGVISTNPAHLMNSHLEAEFVAAVALVGRVPTLVQGTVMKGDAMVSAGNGRARAENDPKISTVIGKALENFIGDEGIIEIVVGKI